MEIRTIRDDEFRDFLRMGEFAFQYELSDEDVENRKSLLELENCWALYEGEEMASKLTIHPMKIWLAGKQMPMGGIAGVASWPEHRRKGHIKALMRKSLEVMKEKGQYVSMLHPFSFAFYRNYGWEMTHQVMKYEIKPVQLPKRKLDYSGRVFRINHDIERLNAMYERYAEDYSGMLKRSELWWKQSILPNEREIVAVYQDVNGVDQGYMIYKVKKEHMEIEEWINLNGEAKRAMIDYVSNHDSMVDKITIHPPVHESFAFWMSDPKIKQEISSYFMSRIVDVEKFLKEYPFQKPVDEKPFIFQVTDSFAEWNNGVFIVRMNEDAENEVEHIPPKDHSSCTQEPKRGVLCDINALSTMFFHCMRPSELAEQGWISGSKTEIERLEKLIGSHKPFLYDFF
ncbi:GNAT family N-acetyltransferase [Pseudalkalibacillus sp. Hm43]|uniref:GNAT family N-acetyltransferase n=1 Tax=Pseudalkalibacillus sp. Hm43 TaxID=3450742 RepID=UPI003F42F710